MIAGNRAAYTELPRFTGATLATALRLASHNPAALLGCDDTLAPGQPASFNRFSLEGHLKSTILHGKDASY